jgi:hypothetical protein
MTKTEFRHYNVGTNDFPLVITASSDADTLPDLAQVTFRIQDVAAGTVTSQRLAFQPGASKTATLTVPAPASASNVVFAVQVRFPATNPPDKPLKLTFAPATGPTQPDEIPPDNKPIVFGNYVLQFR